jgi:hypothetical protein
VAAFFVLKEKTMQTSETVWHFRISRGLKDAVREYAEAEDLTAASAVRELLKKALRDGGQWPRKAAADANHAL